MTVAAVILALAIFLALLWLWRFAEREETEQDRRFAAVDEEMSRRDGRFP